MSKALLTALLVLFSITAWATVHNPLIVTAHKSPNEIRFFLPGLTIPDPDFRQRLNVNLGEWEPHEISTFVEDGIVSVTVLASHEIDPKDGVLLLQFKEPTLEPVGGGTIVQEIPQATQGSVVDMFCTAYPQLYLYNQQTRARLNPWTALTSADDPLGLVWVGPEAAAGLAVELASTGSSTTLTKSPPGSLEETLGLRVPAGYAPFHGELALSLSDFSAAAATQGDCDDGQLEFYVADLSLIFKGYRRPTHRMGTTLDGLKFAELMESRYGAVSRGVDLGMYLDKQAFINAGYKRDTVIYMGPGEPRILDIKVNYGPLYQADWVYYSGHGRSTDGSIRMDFFDTRIVPLVDIKGRWDCDVKHIILGGCAVAHCGAKCSLIDGVTVRGGQFWSRSLKPCTTQGAVTVRGFRGKSAGMTPELVTTFFNTGAISILQSWLTANKSYQEWALPDSIDRGNKWFYKAVAWGRVFYGSQHEDEYWWIIHPSDGTGRPGDFNSGKRMAEQGLWCPSQP